MSVRRLSSPEDLDHLPPETTETTETAKESLATAYTVADALPAEKRGEPSDTV